MIEPDNVWPPPSRTSEENERNEGRPVRSAVRRTAILVLGMHRSGTSAVTRVINLLNVAIPGQLLGPGPENPRGFWEPLELVELHDELLASAGSSWDDISPFPEDWFHSELARSFKHRALEILHRDVESAAMFVVKDPRMCRLLPFWVTVLEEFGAEPRIVIPIRNPMEVAASLKTRNEFLSAKSLLLWLRHVLDAEHASRNLRRSLVSYDGLLGNWQGIVAKLGRDLQVAFPANSHQTGVAIEAFVTTQLRHHTAGLLELELNPRVGRWVHDTYEATLEATTGGKLDTDLLDEIRAELNEADNLFGMLVANGTVRIREATQRIEGLNAEVSQLSTSLEEHARELGTAQAESRELTATSVQLVAERNALQESLNESRESLTALERRIAQLGEEREAHQAQIGERDGHIAALQTQIGERTQEADRLRAEIEAAGAREQSLGEQVEALSTEVEAARAELGPWVELKVQLEQERDTLRVALDAGEANLQAQEQRLAELGAELEAARAEARQLDDAQGRLEQERDQLQAALDDGQARFNAQEQHLSELNVALETQRTEIEAAGAREQSLREQTETLTTEVEAARAKAHEQGLTAARALNERDDLILRLRNRLGIANQHAARLGVDIARATDTVTRLTKDGRRSKERIEDLLRQAASQEDQLRDVVTQMEALRGELAERKGERDSAATAAAVWEGRATTLATELDALHGQLSEFASQRDSATAAVAERESRVADLAAELNGLKGQLAALAAARDRRVGKLEAELVAVHRTRLRRGTHPFRAYMQELRGSVYSLRRPWRWPLFLLPARLRRHLRERTYARLIRRSGIFDAQFYFAQGPHIAASGLDPVLHYLRYGALAGLNPSEQFDTSYYVEQYPDARNEAGGPLVHYLRSGLKEGRQTRNLSVRTAVAEPVVVVMPEPAVAAVPELPRYHRVGGTGLESTLDNAPFLLAPEGLEAVRRAVAGAEPELVADLLIPVYNRPDLLQDLLDTLLANTTRRYLGTIYLGDDSSDAMTEQFIRQFAASSDVNVKVVRQSVNSGFVTNCNALFSCSTAPIAILINTDVQAPPDWIERMLAPFAMNPATALATPLATNAANHTVRCNPGEHWMDTDRIFSMMTPTYPDACTAIGFCMGVRRSALKSDELFSTEFKHGYGEDSDLHYRMLQSGYRSVIVDNLLMHHESEGTYSQLKSPEWANTKAANRALFFEKWGAVHEVEEARFTKEDALSTRRDSVTWFSHFRLAEQNYDVVFVLPALINKIGGIMVVVEIVKRLNRLGFRAQIYVSGPVDPEYVELIQELRPILPRDALRVGRIGVVFATAYNTVACANELAADHGAKVAYFVQGPEGMFDSGVNYTMVTEDYGAVSNIVCGSPFLSQYVRTYYPGEARILEVAIGPDPLKFYPRGSTRNARSVAGCLRGGPEKGTSMLLHFLSMLHQRGFEVHLFGKDSEYFKLPTGFAVEHGDLESADIAALLGSVGFYADFSIYEGIGLLPLEAAFCGAVPVLFNNGGADSIFTGGRDAVFIHGVGGMLECAEALSALAGDQDELESMRRNALTLSKQRSIRRTVSQLEHYLMGFGIAPGRSTSLSGGGDL